MCFSCSSHCQQRRRKREWKKPNEKMCSAYYFIWFTRLLVLVRHVIMRDGEKRNKWKKMNEDRLWRDRSENSHWNKSKLCTTQINRTWYCSKYALFLSLRQVQTDCAVCSAWIRVRSFYINTSISIIKRKLCASARPRARIYDKSWLQIQPNE